MKPWIQKHGFKLTVSLLLVALAISLFTWFNQGPPLPVLKQAPNFELSGLDGGKVSLGDTNGKVRLVEFLFTNCPDVCPATTYNMVKLQNELKKDGMWGNKVHFLSVTFDPERDTPQAFKTYGDKMGMDYNGWTLLTGTEKQTADVAKDFGVMVQKMKDGGFVHTVTSLFLVDQQGQIRKIYTMGEEMDNDEILKMIRQIAGSK